MGVGGVGGGALGFAGGNDQVLELGVGAVGVDFVELDVGEDLAVGGEFGLEELAGGAGDGAAEVEDNDAIGLEDAVDLADGFEGGELVGDGEEGAESVHEDGVVGGVGGGVEKGAAVGMDDVETRVVAEAEIFAGDLGHLRVDLDNIDRRGRIGAKVLPRKSVAGPADH